MNITLKINIPKIKSPHEIALDLMREIRDYYKNEGLEEFVRNLCTPNPCEIKSQKERLTPIEFTSIPPLILTVPKKSLSWSENLCNYTDKSK